jgi:ferrous iron transport protein A
LVVHVSKKTGASEHGLLSRINVGEAVAIHHVRGEASVIAWLAAVGLSQGEVVTIVRRAPFGGPLHVRSDAGAELAIALEIADAIEVEAG